MLDKNEDNKINNSDNHFENDGSVIDTVLNNKIDSTLSHWAVPTNRSKEDMWNAISEKIDFNGIDTTKEVKLTKKKKYQHLIWKSVAVAASVVIILGVSLFFIGNQHTYNAKGNYTMHALPDGSTVQLMPNSHLRYNSIFFDYLRDITLEGEAVFNVSKGSKFSVITKTGQQVHVLGTQFQVYARQNTFEVFCNEGSVGVVSGGKEIAQLEPNHGVVVTNQNSVKKFKSQTYSEDISKKFQGIHKYDNAPLERVLDDFSNAYGVEVDCIIKNKFYTGQFTTSDINKALKYICEPFGLSYEIKGTKVVIR